MCPNHAPFNFSPLMPAHLYQPTTTQKFSYFSGFWHGQWSANTIHLQHLSANWPQDPLEMTQSSVRSCEHMWSSLCPLCKAECASQISYLVRAMDVPPQQTAASFMYAPYVSIVKLNSRCSCRSGAIWSSRFPSPMALTPVYVWCSAGATILGCHS